MVKPEELMTEALQTDKLLSHADDILGVAANVLGKYQENEQNSVRMVAKIGLLYWWYLTISHPAELSAAYYNTAFRDGYDPHQKLKRKPPASNEIVRHCADVAEQNVCS
ncbi:hypothetical protein L2E82_18343 [Cichorium intybus]|uniref:Uncharacterized protein n=1 Tax=Cichorium intybus TaxID=13427 RepID=A0ACB9F9X2_CICIN|nr:hypothetical protein L2E82_18343 [Cichorium intybus]